MEIKVLEGYIVLDELVKGWVIIIDEEILVEGV